MLENVFSMVLGNPHEKVAWSQRGCNPKVKKQNKKNKNTALVPLAFVLSCSFSWTRNEGLATTGFPYWNFTASVSQLPHLKEFQTVIEF